MSQLKVNTIRHTGASSNAIELASDGTATAKITNNLSNRNLIINGAMKVAQRGTSSTTTGYRTVDRMRMYHGGTDEAPTYSQADVASGTTPYSLGFRKCFKVTNGNQTSGAGAGDEIQFDYIVEAQDIANSGWDYTSASSYITLSYWVKSSVAQEFKGHFRTLNGTPQNYPFSLGSLSADTWTKISKTIPGNSNLQINNDNGEGIQINLFSQMGTNMTGSVSENTWAVSSNSTRTPDQTLTWYTTNDATFEITGVQLEVGDVATDFEHRSFGDELARCQRYCYALDADGSIDSWAPIAIGRHYNSSDSQFLIPFPVKMRYPPTIDAGATSAVGTFALNSNGSFSATTATSLALNERSYDSATVTVQGPTSLTTGLASTLYSDNADVAKLVFTAEL